MYNLQNVRILVIGSMDGSEFEGTVEMLNLHSLTFERGGLSNIQYISAPSLTRLRLHDADKIAKSSRVIRLFRDHPERILMKPTSLDWYLSITTNAAMVVFQAWSQLEFLKITFKDFSCRGAFANGLAKRSNPLLPNIITLRARCESHSPDTMDNWDEIARKAFKWRKKLPIAVVEWQYHDEAWHRVTADNK